MSHAAIQSDGFVARGNGGEGQRAADVPEVFQLSESSVLLQAHHAVRLCHRSSAVH